MDCGCTATRALALARPTLRSRRSRQSQAVGDELLTSLASVGDHVVVASSTGHDLDALLLYRDGSLRSFRLPLPPGVTSLSSLTVAPDRGDGWLRVLYAVGDGATYARGLGTVYASAFLAGRAVTRGKRAPALSCRTRLS